MPTKPRALDLFCGAGGATKGLQMAGFHVTGIDIKPQPRYCGDLFIQADALRPPVRLEDFDLIWASPPCQGYSRTRHLTWLRGKTHPLLIEPVRAMFRSLTRCHVIENVMDAPLQGIALRGGMFGLPFTRARRFETNFLVLAPSRSREPVGVGGGMFGNRLRKQHGQLTEGDSQSIPAAYAEHIGRYAMMALSGGQAVPVIRENSSRS